MATTVTKEAPRDRVGLVSPPERAHHVGDFQPAAGWKAEMWNDSFTGEAFARAWSRNEFAATAATAGSPELAAQAIAENIAQGKVISRK